MGWSLRTFAYSLGQGAPDARREATVGFPFAGAARLVRRGGGRRRAMASALWLGAEQGEHAAVGSGQVGDNHAVLKFHWRDDDLAAALLGPGGGRGDIGDLDDEHG